MCPMDFLFTIKSNANFDSLYNSMTWTLQSDRSIIDCLQEQTKNHQDSKLTVLSDAKTQMIALRKHIAKESNCEVREHMYTYFYFAMIYINFYKYTCNLKNILMSFGYILPCVTHKSDLR